MYVNSVNEFVACLIFELSHNDVEYTRVLTVVSLNISDTVSFRLDSEILYCDEHLLMSVQGFYYQPVSNCQVVRSVNKGQCGQFSGLITFLSYPVVYVNIGSA